MEPRPLTVAAVLAAALVGTLVATVAVSTVLRRFVGIPEVRDAWWLELPEGPAILVDGHDAGQETTGYRWALVDARTGDVLEREDYATTVRSPGLPGTPQVVAAGGPRALVDTDEGARLLDWSLADPEADPAAAFPQIPRPWGAMAATGPGVAGVEGADGTRWSVDLEAGVARPAEDAPPVLSPYRRCELPTWLRPDGAEWAFVPSPAGTHELVAGGQPVGLRIPAATFACDERTGRTAVFAGGDPLVVQTGAGSVVLGRLAGRELAWRWDSGAGGDVEVFGSETGGFVVRIGTRLVAITERGEKVWERRL